ncbi:MAG: hypothetical protein WAN00_04720, partial [Trebonia sp.]
MAALPVRGLALEPGFQQEVIAAVGHRPGQPRPCGDEPFVGQPDRVPRADHKPLILQSFDDWLFSGHQQVTRHRPGRGEA